MTEKVDKLVDICNGRSKEKGKYTAYFTPENGHKIQNELLDILDWFTKWNDSVKRLGNNKDNFLPVQSWNSLQSLILGLVGLIEVKVIKDGQTIVPKTTNTDGIEKHFSCSRQNMEVEIHPQHRCNRLMMQELLHILLQQDLKRVIMLKLLQCSIRKSIDFHIII